MYFVELFGTGYEFFFKLLGNHGLAILTVSLAAGLSLEPFRRFAKRLGDRDLKRRAAFECDSEIYGKHYSGVEKYYYVRTLYRLHGYHPVQSLYALAGLLVQIPIFVIAYNFFMDYQGFSGIGFGPIQNLSKPDGLLAGVHLLPLMMTGVNLATAALMANTLKLRGAERGNRQNWQLPALALIFLAALYEAPSGMVLYWTASNVLAFLRELVSNWRAQTVRSRVDNGGDAGFGVVLGERITWIGRTVANALDHPVAALAFLAGFGLMFLWFVFIVFNPERSDFKFLLTGLMALSVLAMIYLSRISLQTRREGFCSRLPLLISFAIVSMIVVYFLYAFPKRDSGAPFKGTLNN